jgi:hypothetical protein
MNSALIAVIVEQYNKIVKLESMIEHAAEQKKEIDHLTKANIHKIQANEVRNEHD